MNRNEVIVKEKLEASGFAVLRNGWPDFLCTRNTVRLLGRGMEGQNVFGEIRGVCAVEVKSGQDKLSDTQRQVHRILQSARIPVYVIRPDEIEAAVSAANRRRLFLTNEEVKGLMAIAEKTRDRVTALQKELASLEAHIHKLNSMIDEAGTVLSDAAIAIERTNPPDEAARLLMD